MNVIEELEKLRLYHYQCEDRWYSCPKSEEGTSNEYVDQDRCICDAEDHNKKLDEIIKYLKENNCGTLES